MKIGLSGGIASGKGRFEDEFRASDTPVFDTDQSDWLLRSGSIDRTKNPEVLATPNLEALCGDISARVKAELGEALPRLYKPDGVFSREALLGYINDPEQGRDNLNRYDAIIRPGTIELYEAWVDHHDRSDTVFSCATLAEAGNIGLVEELHLLNTPREEQFRRLASRAAQQGRPLSEDEINKAIDRQWSFDDKYKAAVKVLGAQHVHVREDVKSA